MDRTEFRNSLLREMEFSVLRHETREHRMMGCLDGIRISRDLLSLEEYEKVVLERTAEQNRLRRENAPIEKYWEHRCGTAQIEFVYEAIKAANYLTHQSVGEVISARAAVVAARILDPRAGDGER